MAPNGQLTHLQEYEIKGSNVEFIGSKIDHSVKYASASTEPAWQHDGGAGHVEGTKIWRIEQFQVVAWPQNKYGSFHEGDSYIVLHSYKSSPEARSLSHDIFFWLGLETTQDEAGTAAYKTVELDEFLGGAAARHREVQGFESRSFLSLFPCLTVLRGGASTGFRHVETEEKSLFRLLQVTSAGGQGIIIREVDPTWKSLNENDVFVLDEGSKIRSWQGKSCSPIEKAKAATAMAEMVSERQGQAEVEVISQTDSSSTRFIQSLGGDFDSSISTASSSSSSFSSSRPLHLSSSRSNKNNRAKSLFRCSDQSGTLKLEPVKQQGEHISLSDFETDDVFLFDSGFQVYVWQGSGASHLERTSWLRAGEAFLRTLDGSWTTPVATVKEGREGPAFISVLDG